MGHIKASCLGTRATTNPEENNKENNNNKDSKNYIDNNNDKDDKLISKLESPRTHLELNDNSHMACAVIEINHNELKGILSTDLQCHFLFISNRGTNYIF